MLNREDMHQYQVRAVQHILDHPRAMLFLDLGLGKTVSTLTAMSDIFDAGCSMGALILAPLRVCQTVWGQECHKWSHLNHLTSSLVHGTEIIREVALRRHRHLYLCNYEALPWLVNHLETHFLARGKMMPFDTLVLDEVTRLKSTRDIMANDDKGSVRGESLLRILKYLPRRIGLTGTPAPNGLQDLFGQYLVLDDGVRLGRGFGGFRERFFSMGGYGNYKPKVTEVGRQQIYQRIADITIEMKGEDYLELPKVIENVISVELTPDLRKAYDRLELEMFMLLDSGADIKAVNTLSLLSKLKQFSNGAIYLNPEQPEWEKIHDLKMDALEEIYDSHGVGPLLVAYQYKHDRERILKKFGKVGAVALDSNIKGKEAEEIILKWNAGEIPMLIGHAASIGHGVNLQFGSNHIVFFGLDYNLELYQQFIGRLWRQGQPRDRVFIHKILTNGTIDQAINEALELKGETQDDLRRALKEYRERKKM